MEKEIIINNQKIIYTLRKSRRAKHMRLTIKTDSSLTVSIPRLLSERVAENFIQQRADWILGKIVYMKSKKSILPPATQADYLKCKELAREIAEKKLRYFNQFYNFKVNRVSIRNSKTRWGSCSHSGNLNFSYRIIYLPESFCDYIIVHELCHLGEFNHSRNFWKLVEKIIPDYKSIRKTARCL